MLSAAGTRHRMGMCTGQVGNNQVNINKWPTNASCFWLLYTHAVPCLSLVPKGGEQMMCNKTVHSPLLTLISIVLVVKQGATQRAGEVGLPLQAAAEVHPAGTAAMQPEELVQEGAVRRTDR